MRAKKIHFVFVLISLVMLCAKRLYAEEGFYNINELPQALQKSFIQFPINNQCGAVRIHKNKPYYLSALHCIRDSISPYREVRIGNHLNYVKPTYYRDIVGKQIRIGNMDLMILASGNCWTDFSLDVLSTAKPHLIDRTIRCFSGDWVIFKILKYKFKAKGCVAPSLEAIPSQSPVFALGGANGFVFRNIGLTALNGRFYSKGVIWDLSELLLANEFPNSIVPLWQEILPGRELALAKHLLITDADIIFGMSGGPVFYNTKLVGITTNQLLPTYTTFYAGLNRLEVGYTFGIHGSVPITMIYS